MQDTIGIILNNGEVWYLKYLLPYVLTLIFGIISFFLSQLYIRHLDRIRSRDKYLGYLRVIREEIKRNLDLMCQLHAYLYVRATPTFKLSFFVGDDMFSGISTICLNYELLNEIFYRYFDYRHIQDRLDKIIKITNDLKEIRAHSAVDHEQEHLAERSLESERGGTIMLISGNTRVSFNTYNQITDELNSRNKRANLKKLPDNYLKELYDKFQVDEAVVNAVKFYGDRADLSKRPKFYES